MIDRPFLLALVTVYVMTVTLALLEDTAVSEIRPQWDGLTCQVTC